MPLALDYAHLLNLLNTLFRGYQGPPFSIRFPHWSWSSTISALPVFSLVCRNSETLDNFVHSSETALGEAFVSGEFDIEGDIFSAFEVAEWLLDRPTTFRDRIGAELSRDLFVALSRLSRGRKHSRQRDANSISHHYDLPVEFYEPWLGPTLLYSSAYFHDQNEELDAAQRAKLDLICRKLNLHAGDRLLDIGCGWGSLPIYAAEVYQARTRGITISRSQARTAARRIADAHLGDHCFVECRDYRDAKDLPDRFEKIASIGMFEHVGAKNLKFYFRTAFELLRPGGLFLNSGIVRALDSPRRQQSFIDQYVFPDGELVTLSEVVRAAEEGGFEIRDVESLREHYALTLRRWVERLQEHYSELRATVSDRILRTWLLYMAGSAAAFERGSISVCQILLRRPSKINVQFSTRGDRYSTEHEFPMSRVAA